ERLALRNDRLDDGARNGAGKRGRLRAMQLHRGQPHQARDLIDVGHRLIYEHTDYCHKWWQRGRNRSGPERVDEAGALGPEDKTDSRGTSLDRVLRILQPGEPANLDHHFRPRHAGAPVAASIKSRSASPGLASVMKRSPIRNALYPRRLRRLRSSAVFK